MFERTKTFVVAKTRLTIEFNERWSDSIKIYRFVVRYGDYARKTIILQSKAGDVLGFAHAFLAIGFTISSIFLRPRC